MLRHYLNSYLPYIAHTSKKGKRSLLMRLASLNIPTCSNSVKPEPLTVRLVNTEAPTARSCVCCGTAPPELVMVSVRWVNERPPVESHRRGRTDTAKAHREERPRGTFPCRTDGFLTARDGRDRHSVAGHCCALCNHVMEVM